MTLSEIYDKLDKRLQSSYSNSIDLSIAKTFYNDEPGQEFICGLLHIENGDELDYEEYAYGSTIEEAIENFYLDVIQEKIILSNKVIKHRDKRQVTKKLNLRKG